MNVVPANRLALGLLLSAAGALPADAHAMPVRTEPKEGAMLEAPPARVVVWFDQELESGPSRIRLFDHRGHEIDGAAGGLDLRDPEHRRLKMVLPAALVPGAYLVRWTAVSAEDGDRTEGEFRFEIGAGPGKPAD